MALVSELARAKLNLTLRVLGRRSDGYHEIDSLVAFADIGDRVVLDTDGEFGGEVGVKTTGPFASAIDGPNLATTALERLKAKLPGIRLGHVLIDKQLPVSAGIGGGSADAAAVLRAVRRVNPQLASAAFWSEVARSLGADVPICLAGRAARMRGIGEQIAEVAALPRLHAVLANPQVPVPRAKTAAVFRMLDAPALGPERTADPQAPDRFADRHALLDLMRRTGNDLTPAAAEVMPDIVAVTTALERQPGAELVQLSGAGPTCYGIFPTEAAATAAAARLRESFPHWWIAATTIG
ncbi:MAG: 4-(cytidine 5'-diphospho)-2-C-methyl-D-erythritol kinase [Hyphomicrobium sp.]